MHLPQPSDGGAFTPPPAGTHLAICHRVIDLGTQITNYNGETKKAHKILIGFELPDEQMDDGKPFTVFQRFTWSMHEKANLRKTLEAWRGAAFKDSDFGPTGFDIKNILGKGCTLNIVHIDKSGTIYANIAGIGKPMKGIQIPPQTNSSIYLWMHKDRWDSAVFASLSPGIQAAITKSPEYHDLMKTMNGNGQDYHDESEDPGADMHDEPIPF